MTKEKIEAQNAQLKPQKMGGVGVGRSKEGEKKEEKESKENTLV